MPDTATMPSTGDGKPPPSDPLHIIIDTLDQHGKQIAGLVSDSAELKVSVSKIERILVRRYGDPDHGS